MASSNALRTTLFLFLVSIVDICIGSRKLTSLYRPPHTLLTYHNGALLEGDIPVSILWYGDFTPAQKSILVDFLLSLTPHRSLDTLVPIPSVSQWWRTVDEYMNKAGKNKTQIILTNQISHPSYSLGKFLKRNQVSELAVLARRSKRGGLALVLTSDDVAVEGFCMDRCGFHSSESSTHSAYIWVGNSASQCPGLCAWPFHQPIYGPRNPPLLPPNNDVGLDGMVINLATLLAGTVTNPFGNGFFQGAKDAPVEVAAVCPGVFGKGAYPGYAGHLLVDHISSASYNANGLAGKKYLLPAMFDPSASSCSPMV